MRRPVALVLALLALLPAGGARADGEGAWVPTYPGNGVFTFYAEAAAFPDGTAYVSRLGSATGFQAELLRSRDSGRTWTRLVPPYGPLQGFSIVQMGSSALGYAVGGFGRDLAVTRDGAETWQAVPHFDADAELHHVGTIAGGRTAAALGWVSKTVNGCPQPPKETLVVYTHDHGRSWRRSVVPDTGLPIRVEFATDLVGAAVLVGKADGRAAGTTTAAATRTSG